MTTLLAGLSLGQQGGIQILYLLGVGAFFPGPWYSRAGEPARRREQGGHVARGFHDEPGQAFGVAIGGTVSLGV